VSERFQQIAGIASAFTESLQFFSSKARRFAPLNCDWFLIFRIYHGQTEFTLI
jgi:hypothetical protein